MPNHNRGFNRRLARASTADKTRALSQQAAARRQNADTNPASGPVSVGVGVADGQVVMGFPRAVLTANFLPADARQLAAGLVAMADKAEGVEPPPA